MKKKGLRSSIVYLGLSLCLAGGLITYTGPATKFQYATYEDIVEGPESVVQIEEDDVPLAAPKVTTKTTTKTTTKKENMSTAATKNSKATKTSTKTSTKTASTSKQKVVTATTVQTTVLTTTVKKSKVKTIKTTVKTTVKTTTTAVATQTVVKTASKTLTVNKFSDIKGYIDANVYAAFEKLQFKYIVDTKIPTTGVFSVGNHWIKLKSANGYYLMHELGHFVAALEKNADKTSEWASIYSAEKSKYTGSNKTYITSTAGEYFAESFRDYSENPTALRNARPKTYAYMDKVVKGINVTNDTKWFYIQYGAYWDSVIDF